MQKHWLKRIGAPDLIVVALGWASEPRLVQNIPTEGHDVLVLYDYRTLEPLAAADTAPYGQITLLAWSFGVWVAEQVCRDIPFRPSARRTVRRARRAERSRRRTVPPEHRMERGRRRRRRQDISSGPYGRLLERTGRPRTRHAALPFR